MLGRIAAVLVVDHVERHDRHAARGELARDAHVGVAGEGVVGPPEQRDVEAVRVGPHLGQELAAPLAVGGQEAPVLLDGRGRRPGPFGAGERPSCSRHVLELGPARLPALLERDDGPQHARRRGRRPGARSRAGPASAGRRRRAPCPPRATACRGSAAGTGSRRPGRAGPGSRRGRSRRGSSSCSPGGRRPRARSAREHRRARRARGRSGRRTATASAPRARAGRRRRGRRAATSGSRRRGRGARRAAALRQATWSTASLLAARLSAPRPGELGAAAAERVAVAVDLEVADRAAVVAGLAGELVAGTTISLPRIASRSKLPLASSPSRVLLLRRGARRRSSPSARGRAAPRPACRAAARRPAARPGSWRRRPAARCARRSAGCRPRGSGSWRRSRRRARPRCRRAARPAGSPCGCRC